MNEVNAETWYSACTMCPRGCGINRYKRRGFCGEGADLRLAWAGLHFGEEPVLTKHGGSGAVFLTGCNLQCSFCQNYQISQNGLGRAVGQDEFVEILLALQAVGAENINIVTGTHQAILLAQYIATAKRAGLTLPIVWNTSGYESPAVIRLLADTVDIWLADLKTISRKIAAEAFQAADYPEIAEAAIETMCRQTSIRFKNENTAAENANDEIPQLISGVIVRHLALPGSLADTYQLLRWFAQKLKHTALLSLMTQYTPVDANTDTKKISSFENRLLSAHEDKALRRFLSELDINDGFYQELVPDYSWLPDFTRIQSFSSALSKPIWHYTCGFIK